MSKHLAVGVRVVQGGGGQLADECHEYFSVVQLIIVPNVAVRGVRPDRASSNRQLQIYKAGHSEIIGAGVYVLAHIPVVLARGC